MSAQLCPVAAHKRAKSIIIISSSSSSSADNRSSHLSASRHCSQVVYKREKLTKNALKHQIGLFYYAQRRNINIVIESHCTQHSNYALINRFTARQYILIIFCSCSFYRHQNGKSNRNFRSRKLRITSKYRHIKVTFTQNA